MIKLINGRGQLGEQLKIDIKDARTDRNVYIYHTWNPWKRDRPSQENEYKKFVQFAESHKHKGRIILISTCSQNDNYYVHFKQLAEAYMISNIDDCMVIRLPNLVGNKGILKKLKEQSAEPYGQIELLSLASASKKIINLINYRGDIKSFSIEGEKISAALINEILKIL